MLTNTILDGCSDLDIFKMIRFQTSPLLKPFSEVSVFIGISGVFVWMIGENVSKVSVFKRNALVWMGPVCQPKVEYLFERPYLPHSANLTTLCDIWPVSINF